MGNDKINKRGIIYIILATLGFSLIPILAQIGLSPNLTAATLLFYRFFIAAILFLVYCIITKKKIMLENKQQYLCVGIAGGIYSVQCIFFFSSFNYVSSSIGEIIYHCYPLFVLILAYIFLKEPITRNKILGVILSVVGVCIVLYAPWDSAQMRGIIYVIITAFVSSIYMIYTKKKVSEIDTTILTMYLCMVCSIVYLAYSLVQGEFTLLYTKEIVLNVCILAVCSTVVGFFCFMKAISLLSVGQVSILSLLEPVFTIIIAYFMLGVGLSMLQIIGTIIILVAIYIYDRT